MTKCRIFDNYLENTLNLKFTEYEIANLFVKLNYKNNLKLHLKN